MANEQKEAEKRPNQPPTAALARLLEAEKKADEIVGRAQAEAAEIVAAAKIRAKQILETASAPETDAAETLRREMEKEKRLIMEEANRRIEAMRSAAAARDAEAVEKLVTLLVAES